MRINFLKTLFGVSSSKIPNKPMTSVAQKVTEISENIKLVKRAEDRLQSRLTDWHTLMRDVGTGDILEISTGKKFSGKFAFQTDELEHLQHVKDGKTAAVLVRDKNKNNLLAITPTVEKSFSKEEHDGFNWGKLAECGDEVSERMRHAFIIKELVKSGKDSIVIQGKF